MKMSKWILCGLLLGTSAQAATLAEMQQAAVANRAVVQRYMATVAKSQENLNIARGNYFPSVDLGYTANTLSEATLREDRENSIATGRISWNLFAGFQDKYNITSAEMLREVEQHRLTGIRQDIQLAVALSYLAVYDRRASLKVAEDAYKTLAQFYRDGENRFEVGLIGKNELLKFRVDYDNADINVKAAQAALDKSVNDLARQAGGPVTLDELMFAEFDTLPAELDEQQHQEKMLAYRSELKALEGLITAGEAQVRAAYAEYYPRVDAVTSYSHYDDSLVNGSGDNTENELRAQLVMSVNLFKGLTTEAKTSRAKLAKRELQYDLQELQEALTTELRNLFIDYRVSLANVEVARRSIEQAEENLRITRLKYDEGLQRVSDLLDAITSLSRAQANEVAVVRTVFLNYFRIVRMVDGFAR